MIRPILRRAVRAISVASLLAVTATAPAAAAAPERSFDFDEAELAVGEVPPVVASAIDRSVQWRAVDLDVDALLTELRSDPVEIALFDDAEVELPRGSVSGSAGDGFVWSSVDGFDSATLTIGGEQVRGTVTLDGRSFSITPVGDEHVIIENGDLDAEMGEPLAVPDDLTGLPTGAAVSAARELIADGEAERSPRTAAADGETVVRVLTVYTNDARDEYGGDAAARDAIESIVDDSNVVLENSEVTMRLESAGIEHVDYDDASSIDDDLTALTLADPEAMFEVHVTRELVEADIVMLVRGDTLNDRCGLAWVLDQPSSALNDELAMGVVDTRCAPPGVRGYIHEVGHILGAGHGHVANDGVFPYSAGYNAGNYYTIMEYDDGCSCDPVPYFSAPRSVTTEVDGNDETVSIGDANHDNTRTLNETAAVVANFRPFPLVPTQPARLADTREGQSTIDGEYAAEGRRGAGSILTLDVAGRGDVPADAAAVMLNVTAVKPDAGGYITVWPCDADQPTASNLNYVAGQVVPNSVLAQLDPQGRVCIYTRAATHLLVDVNAVVPAGGTLQTIVPARYLETRDGPNLETFDHEFEGIGMQAADSTLQLQIAGRGDVPLGTDAVMLNVTAVAPQANGYVTVWPCGEDQPTASSLNYGPGQVVPNAVLAKLDAQGRVCIYTRAATHLLVDVNGSIAANSRILTVTPARLLETRSGPNNETVDGEAQGLGPLGPDDKGAVPVVLETEEGPQGRGGVTPGAWAMIANVTAVAPDRQGYLTVWPCTDDIPTASNLNYAAGQVVANMAVAQFGLFEEFDGPCIYTSGRTDLLVDVVAYF